MQKVGFKFNTLLNSSSSFLSYSLKPEANNQPAVNTQIILYYTHLSWVKDDMAYFATAPSCQNFFVYNELGSPSLSHQKVVLLFQTCQCD